MPHLQKLVRRSSMLQGFSLCPLFCGVFKPQRAPVASTCLHSKEALRGAPQNRAPSSKEHNLRSTFFEGTQPSEHLLRRNTTFGVLIVLAKELLRSGEQKFGLKNTFFYTSSFSRRKFLEIYTNKEGMSEFE